MKERLDVLLVKQGLAQSREKARAVIMAGDVFVDGQREDKAGTSFDESKVHIEVRGTAPGRNGEKADTVISSGKKGYPFLCLSFQERHDKPL